MKRAMLMKTSLTVVELHPRWHAVSILVVHLRAIGPGHAVRYCGGTRAYCTVLGLGYGSYLRSEGSAHAHE